MAQSSEFILSEAEESNHDGASDFQCYTRWQIAIERTHSCAGAYVFRVEELLTYS